MSNIISISTAFFILQLTQPVYAHSEKLDCAPRDDQAALAKACEKAINITSMRIQCLKQARLVATIEFCARQFGVGSSILNCIQEIDQNK
ncbi:hypothetical protein [Bdellovibrio sp. HCB337]|uniref:hypothetical protein n=1 Tax=Bdellovibrio sp. HCB337 TaxID=3394358 RepID=UPI0039A61427